MTASFGLRDIFERPFDGEDDPRIRVAQAITRAEAEAILEHRSDLILALSAPSPVEGGGELEYAQRLATVAASKFGPPPGWKPLGDMFGVLSQIDNCLTGLEAPTSPPQATNSVTNQCDLGDLCICISAHAQCSHWKTSVYAELAEAASRVINDAARERDGQSLVDDRALEALAQALKGILS